jgi:two-component system chemotaxis response regulator CheY
MEAPARQTARFSNTSRGQRRLCKRTGWAKVFPKFGDLVNTTLLVVDDDDAIRESLAELLTRRGFDVITAGNGREAIDVVHARGTKPMVVVLDMTMPVMDGATFLRQQPNDPLLADVPVVIISARLQRPEPTPAGVRGLLVKPISLNVLVRMIEEVRAEAAASEASRRGAGT